MKSESSSIACWTAISRRQSDRASLTKAYLLPTLHWQGREKERQQLTEWIADPKIVLAGIVGVGGLGKSTLAAKLYEETTMKFWVDLGRSIANFATVARQILRQVDGRDPTSVEAVPETMLANALVRVLQNRSCLLVLDNLESILDGDRNWQDFAWQEFFKLWLQHGSGSTVLVTTREKPNLPNAHVCWLSLEKGLEPTEGAALLRSLGIRGEETELRQFSETIGGYPLSLWLVAGFLHAEEGEDPQIRYLERSAYEVPGLHRGDGETTMWQILAWSWERLKPRSQQLLQSAGVYRIPFDGEMAAAVLAAETEEVEPLLKDLRGRSLLQTERDETGRRYWLHPLVAEFVRRRGGDLTEVHKRAIVVYRSRCKPREAWQTDDDVAEYLEIFHHFCELENYDAAFDTIYDGNERGTSVTRFLDLRGYPPLGIELYQRLVAAWGKAQPLRNWNYTASLTCLGNTYDSLGQYRKAINFHQQSLEIDRKIGDRYGEAISLGGLGNAYEALGQSHEAINFYQQSLEIDREIGDRHGEAISLSNLGAAYDSLGQYRKAINFHRQSLKIRCEIGDRHGEAISLNNLGVAYGSLGQYRKAINFHRQSLKIKREIGDRYGEANSLGNLGAAYDCLGQYRKGINFHQQSLEMKHEIGDHRGEASSLFNMGLTLKRLERNLEAVKAFQQSRAVFVALELNTCVRRCNEQLQSLTEKKP